jgi:predicted ArsR family transcriptional regulator
MLEANGFEPFEADGVIRLRNCPFDALVPEHRELTCGLNLAFLESVASTLGDAHVRARRQSQPGMCCVEFGPADGRAAT